MFNFSFKLVHFHSYQKLIYRFCYIASSKIKLQGNETVCEQRTVPVLCIMKPVHLAGRTVWKKCQHGYICLDETLCEIFMHFNIEIFNI